MTELFRKQILEHIKDVEDYFLEIKKVLELSPNADRGRVLASLKKLIREEKKFSQETTMVAKHLGYSSWGFLVRTVRNNLDKE